MKGLYWRSTNIYYRIMLYVIVLLISLFLQLLSKKIYSRPVTKILDFFSFTLMFFIAGIRYGVGRDFWTYFNNVSSSSFQIEFGVRLFVDLITTNGLSMQLFIFTMSILSGVLFYVTVDYFDKLRNFRYLLIVMVFSLIFFDSMNISRQFLAISFVSYSSIFIDKNKFIKFAFIILLATSIHYTAILFILAYPLVMVIRKTKNIVTMINLIVCISILNMIFPILSQIIQSFIIYGINFFPRYLLYVPRLSSGDYYFSEMFFLQSFVFLSIINLNKHKIIANKNFITKTILPLSMFYIFTYSIFTFSDLTMRFYYYYTFFFIIAIGFMFTSSFRSKFDMTVSNFIIIIFTIVTFGIAIYSVYMISDLSLYPYKTFFYY